MKANSLNVNSARDVAGAPLAAPLRAVGSAGGSRPLLAPGPDDRTAGIQKGVRLRPLTKLEEQRMATIPTRQRANQQTKQVAGGREYEGAGFAAVPAVVEFVDYDVGSEYRREVKLTNVSFTFNAMRVEPLPVALRAVLEVEYVPQSRMVAGRQCTITVIFSPKEATDIDDFITIVTSTGTMALPVRCRCKRTAVTVSSQSMDFGRVVIGETATRTVTLRNDGALPARLTVGGEALQLFLIEHSLAGPGGARGLGGGPDEATASSGPLTAPRRVFSSAPDFAPLAAAGKSANLVLQPFSTLNLSVTFAPLEPCHFHSSFYLAPEDAACEDMVVFVSGEATTLPVFISQGSVLDFQCTFLDTLYRDSFIVTNTSQSAARVTPAVPAALATMLEFVPKFGFIQAGGTLSFQVKFTPAGHIAPSGRLNVGQAFTFEQHITVHVSDQTLPLSLRILSNISNKGLRFTSPPNGELALGVLHTDERVVVHATLVNGANVARQLALANVPANITVRDPPHEVFVVLPREALTLTLEVGCPGGGVGQFTQTIRVLSEHADVCTLTVTGQGRAPPAAIAPATLQLPPCAAGATIEARSVLTNLSSVPQDYSFLTLHRHGVRVQPSAGTLLPKASVPLVVTFEAREDVVDLSLPPHIREEDYITVQVDAAVVAEKPDPKAARGKKGAKVEEDAERAERQRLLEQQRAQFQQKQRERDEQVVELRKLTPWEVHPEQHSLHRTVLVPCRIQPTPKATLPDITGAAADANRDMTRIRPVFLSVRCCVVKPVATIQQVAAPTPVAAITAAAASAAKAAKPVTPPLPPAKKDKDGRGKDTKDAKGAPSGNAAKAPPPPAAVVEVVPTGKGASAQEKEQTEARPTTDLDFGSVPSQQRVQRSLIVRHCGTVSGPMRLYVYPLDPHGVFALERPPASAIPHGGHTEIVVGFKPLERASYTQQLHIVCETGSYGALSRHTIVATLRGEGQPAVLAIVRVPTMAAAAPTASKKDKDKGGNLPPTASPPPSAALALPKDDTTSAAAMRAQFVRPTRLAVDMGVCTAGESSERAFQFANLSAFPLTIRTSLIDVVNRNPNFSCPCIVAPDHLTIPAGESSVVAVTFAPLVAGVFSCVARVRYGGDGCFHDIALTGRATRFGAYIIPPAVTCAEGTDSGPTPRSLADGGLGGTLASHVPATAALADRLSSVLSLLPAAAVSPPGSSPLHPMDLNFVTSARRVFSEGLAAPAAAQPADVPTSPGKRRDRRGSVATTPRSPRDDGPGLACTVMAGTATHIVTIGNTRSSAAGAEFSVEGLTDQDTRMGWRMALVVEGDVHPAAGPPPAEKPEKGKDKAAPPPPGVVAALKGTLQPGQSISLKLTFTPTAALLESLPLSGVDVTAVASLRVLARGGTPAIGPEGEVLHLRLRGVAKHQN